MSDRRCDTGPTTFARWDEPTGRAGFAPTHSRPRKYDIRVVDRFYAYCQAVAQTDRQRDEAHACLRNTLKRSIWSMLIAASFLFYYVMDRAAQAMALF